MIYELKQPRVALYQSWVANPDEGWTEWLLDHYGIALHVRSTTTISVKAICADASTPSFWRRNQPLRSCTARATENT